MRQSRMLRSSVRSSRSRYQKSEQLFAAASRILPGGVDSPVRAFKSVGATPLFVSRARGAILEDVDGHKYIDYVMSWGPLIHGHAPKGLLKALAAAAARGTSFGAPTELETRDWARPACGAADAVDGAGAVRQFGHRGRDERDPRRARGDAERSDRQVRRVLSRPRRQLSGPGGVGRHDARRADESGRRGGR